MKSYVGNIKQVENGKIIIETIGKDVHNLEVNIGDSKFLSNCKEMEVIVLADKRYLEVGEKVDNIDYSDCVITEADPAEFMNYKKYGVTTSKLYDVDDYSDISIYV